jgi:hypothetical protein
MDWDELSAALDVTPDERGWLLVTRRYGARVRRFVLQHIIIDGWELALVQTTIASELELGVTEALTRLVPFPLGALVLNEGFYVLRQTLPLAGMTAESLELALRCLDIQARKLVPQRPCSAGSDLFNHYAD